MLSSLEEEEEETSREWLILEGFYGRTLGPTRYVARHTEHKRAHVGLPLSQPFSFAHARYAHACATWITHDPVHTSGKYSFKRALKTGNISREQRSPPYTPLGRL